MKHLNAKYLVGAAILAWNVAAFLLIGLNFAWAQGPIPPLQQDAIDEFAPVANLPIGDLQRIDTSGDGQIMALASEGAVGCCL
jgi:hypothetical protein